MEIPFIVGEKVYLRPLRKEDIGEKYLAWINDPKTSRYLESGTFPQNKGDLEEFFETVTESTDNVIFAISDKNENKHIGNVKIGPIDWVNRSAEFGLLIGDKTFWGRGIGEEVTRMVVEYAFNDINLRRVELGVFEEHESAKRVYEKVGFEVEGCFRGALFHEGEYKDHIWMSILRSNYDSPGK